MIEFLTSWSSLCLKSMCSCHCLKEPKGALRFPKFESKEYISGIFFLILSYLQAKCFSCGAMSHSDVVFLISP